MRMPFGEDAKCGKTIGVAFSFWVAFGFNNGLNATANSLLMHEFIELCQGTAAT